jgi:RNA polymerase sigma-70 factor (ECF subfamily)
VLLLYFLEDLPITDVATIVGCPAGTVKSRPHHGKRLLRTLLRKERHD